MKATKTAGDMSNKEFVEHIANQVRDAYIEGQLGLLDEAIATAKLRLIELQARREQVRARKEQP